MDITSTRSKKNGTSNSDDSDGRDSRAIVRRRPPTIAELLASTSSTLATIMFTWTIIRQYCPHNLRQYLHRYLNKFIDYIYPNPYVRIAIYEFLGERLNRSKAFAAVESYLSTKLSDDAKRLKAEVGDNKNNFSLNIDEYEKITDEYENAEFWWTLSKITGSAKKSTSLYPEPDRRYYQLKFHKKHRSLVTESYLKHVLKEGREIKVNRRQRKLYTNGTGNRWTIHRQTTMWSEVYFEHPANFDTIAMDPEKKQEIVEDLLTFRESKDYYARIGKAWKRGYLLYGPPGTGKSTMIAAMANLLNYDVYDLELTAVKDNTELRKLLIETTSKSIIVIEDIDCSLELTGQRKIKKEGSSKDEEKVKEKEKLIKEHLKKEEEEVKSRVTLSGLLNFIDGIWSACGGERLIVFTTNHVEKLDPALIRSGRMDKHIELSYCTFEAFKVLSKNYLNIETHELFEEIQDLIKGAKITPADVAENLMPKSRQEVAENSLRRLIRSLEELKRAAEIESTKEEKRAEKSEESPKSIAVLESVD
ncbi:AAA-ATPase At3g28580-like [Cucurbita pepo subsp. pepo]|uniref:AAA-ATPase At3g28580-like n=1 Tax=Cucurbita pepo subsp. pepo TaxID=3664 RepID=UPI000C9D7E65|nr:AAA-ATPase At3g28580-like [Cucurbita pepo subsp. pepo]XP_023541550.1 AAA-ATPase At3g28580-like [Cucurbita pepo subsp. pepo]XP_023541551.1 AAA-ATPase At3g28580-like [Cucurbita pepo subsp. pepo]